MLDSPSLPCPLIPGTNPPSHPSCEESFKKIAIVLRKTLDRGPVETENKLFLTFQPSLLPESSLLFDSAFVCSLSARPLQALDTFVNHESIFKSVFFFSWIHTSAKDDQKRS